MAVPQRLWLVSANLGWGDASRAEITRRAFDRRTHRNSKTGRSLVARHSLGKNRRLQLARSTVGAVLRRLGLGRLKSLEERPPVIRYERKNPGELIHLDTKRLGRIVRVGHRITGCRKGQSNTRGTGWEALHVAIDDATRLAYTEVLADEKKETAIAFLSRSCAFFRANGVTPERIMTDNGSAYKSRAFRDALNAARVRHIRTRPYTPRTNGKAERFIQTLLREWAYAAPYETSQHRTNAMSPFIDAYNTQRPH